MIESLTILIALFALLQPSAALAGDANASPIPVPNGSAPAGVTAPDAADPARTTPDDQLTGRDIYKRVLDNRFDTFLQTSSLISGDRNGNEQKTSLRMWFENFRDADDNPREGIILSKTLVRYLEPFDLRHTGYLVVNNLDRTNDQFVYLNSSRVVRRINLRGEAVFGSDFSFEDVIPKELEDATYVRLADSKAHDIDCFVVEATPSEWVESEYSRIRVFVEKDRPVVLRTLYWDDRNVQIKEMQVDPSAIERINEVWVPRRMTMRNTKMESFSTLIVSKIRPNLELRKSHFDLTRLQGH